MTARRRTGAGAGSAVPVPPPAAARQAPVTAALDRVAAAAGRITPGRHDPYETLARRDRVLRALQDAYGRPDPFHWVVAADRTHGRFAALLLHVVSQQISTTAALAIFTRIESHAGQPPTPAAVLALNVDGLRACGLSQAKAASLTDIAHRIVDESLALDRLDAYRDDEVIARLTAARGIGPWTAQMFLIHQLRRPDVFPAGDLGIRHALHRAFQQTEIPSVADADQMGRRWSPYRTYAAALLWASLSPRDSNTAAPSTRRKDRQE